MPKDKPFIQAVDPANMHPAQVDGTSLVLAYNRLIASQGARIQDPGSAPRNEYLYAKQAFENLLAAACPEFARSFYGYVSDTDSARKPFDNRPPVSVRER